MTTAITTIPFHGTSLYVLAGDTPEATEVAMRPIVETMGLKWQPQMEKIKAHPVLQSAYTLRGMQMPGDDQEREHATIPLNRFHFWLATINPNRVPDAETRDRVIVFQTEAADVLFDHFFGRAFEAHDAFPSGSIEQIERSYGINRMLAHKVTGLEASVQAITAAVGALLSVVKPSEPLLIRRGKTAKQIWDDNHLPPKLRGSSVWFGNRLAEMSCFIQDEGRADRGNGSVRLFDPDKAAICLRNGLLHKSKVYASERMGQGRFRLVPKEPVK